MRCCNELIAFTGTLTLHHSTKTVKTGQGTSPNRGLDVNIYDTKSVITTSKIKKLKTGISNKVEKGG